MSIVEFTAKTIAVYIVVYYTELWKK